MGLSVLEGFQTDWSVAWTAKDVFGHTHTSPGRSAGSAETGKRRVPDVLDRVDEREKSRVALK
jgi:hypothetical protein